MGPISDIQRTKSELTPKELDNKIISKTQIDDEANTSNVSKDDVSGNSVLPRWVVFDRKVLRFYSYFVENVFNSPIEKERVRKCVIYYFLEDDTVMIDEIGASTFLKRQKVP